MIVWYSAPPASAPEPRFTARSMLSLGTEDFLAFWMASYSVGLPLMSPPPIRAATSMFLISLANILPRRASMTAFLCLVVAHLEWPLMMSSSVHRSPRFYRRGRARPRGVSTGGTDRSQAGSAAGARAGHPYPGSPRRSLRRDGGSTAPMPGT